MEPELVTPRDSDVHLGRVLVSLGYASDADEAARLAHTLQQTKPTSFSARSNQNRLLDAKD